MGGSAAEIAKKYHVSREDVEKALTSAERLQFIEAYRDLVRDRLVPLAMVVYEMHLKNGSLEAAKGILEGLSILQKPGAPGPTAPEGEIESLLAYRVRRSTPSASPTTPAPPPTTVLEGDVLN